MHVAIVGAGVGGLAAAVRIASSGLRVTLLEAGDGPGGKLREAEIGDRAIDVGPTVFTLRDVFDDIFASAGERLDDHLTLHRSETIARHVFADGSRLDLYADQSTVGGRDRAVCRRLLGKGIQGLLRQGARRLRNALADLHARRTPVGAARARPTRCPRSRTSGVSRPCWARAA